MAGSGAARRSQVRAGQEIAPVGRTQSERRRRLALAGGFRLLRLFGIQESRVLTLSLFGSLEDQTHRRISEGLEVAAVVGAKGLPVVIGQGSACTTILSAAEMQLHSALKNAQKGGEMTGFMRLGEQDVFSPITVTRGQASLPMTSGLGIEVNKEKLQRLAGRT